MPDGQGPKEKLLDAYATSREWAAGGAPVGASLIWEKAQDTAVFDTGSFEEAEALANIAQIEYRHMIKELGEM